MPYNECDDLTRAYLILEVNDSHVLRFKNLPQRAPGARVGTKKFASQISMLTIVDSRPVKKQPTLHEHMPLHQVEYLRLKLL